MSALTLTPGTLTDPKYPASAQTLLERFANALYAPTATRTLYSGPSMNGSADGTTLWFNDNTKTLNVYDSNSAWLPALEGNTKTGTSSASSTYTGAQISNIASAFAWPGPGQPLSSNLVAVSLNVRSLQSRVLVTATIPAATSSSANDTLVALLFKEGIATAVAASYQAVPTAEALVSLQIHYLDTPGKTGNITYGVRLGSTAASTTSIGVLRKTTGATLAYGHLTITAQELNQPA